MLGLKHRAVQVKVVKDQNAPESDPMVAVQVAANYAAITKDLITHAALTIGGVYCVCKIVERICR